MDFFGVREQARCEVRDDRAVFPRIPVTHDDFHELVGSVVAVVVNVAGGSVPHVQRHSPSFIEVTMFQAARPSVARSRLAKTRANSRNGSK